MISVRGLFIASWITLAVVSAISNDAIEEVNGNKIPQENRTDLHKLIRKNFGWLNKRTPTTSSPTTSPTQKEYYEYNKPGSLCGKELRANGAQCLNSSNCKKKQCMKVVRGHICNDQNYDRLFFIESVAGIGVTECIEKCGNHPTCRAIIMNDGCHLYFKECTNFSPHEQYITATLVIPGTDFPNRDCYSDYYITNKCVKCISGEDCYSGFCNKNKCMDCASNYYIGNQCVECISGDDCGVGEVCNKNKCEEAKEIVHHDYWGYYCAIQGKYNTLYGLGLAECKEICEKDPKCRTVVRCQNTRGQCNNIAKSHCNFHSEYCPDPSYLDQKQSIYTVDTYENK